MESDNQQSINGTAEVMVRPRKGKMGALVLLMIIKHKTNIKTNVSFIFCAKKQAKRLH